MVKYQITDPSLYPIKNIFDRETGDMIALRDKTTKNIYEIATEFLHYTKKYKKISVINRHYEIGLELGFDMIHLNSDQFQLIDTLDRTKLIVSCHSLDEILYCQNRGVKYATISPIFVDKPKAMGIERLKQISQSVDINLIALGGIISHKEVELLSHLNLFGFASIRYFMREN